MSATADSRVPEVAREEPDDHVAFLGAGPLLAVALGFALIPFRESTSAANLGFAFVILTIVISAFGGRAAGIATALASALSMDFFLTKPYLSLRMDDNHDLVAFVGLAMCGLVAAALGSPQRIAALREARRHAGLVHSALVELEGAGPLEAELARVLEAARHVLPVRALVVRDAHDQCLAASPHQQGLVALPDLIVEGDLLLARGSPPVGLGRRGPPLPAQGARVALMTGNRRLGWLDLWGDGAPAGADSRRALADLARLLAMMVARHRPPAS